MARSGKARAICLRAMFNIGVVGAALLPTAAQADMAVSKDATQNVSCQAAHCTATAESAVMNVRELKQLLAANPHVALDAGVASTITITAPLTWTSASILDLRAIKSVVVNERVTVAGQGGVNIYTANSGLSFAPKASLSFWNLTSPLTINGKAYTLVPDVKTLANGLQQSKGVGLYALANDYDAAPDGSDFYPIYLLGAGSHIEGLGHSIAHLLLRCGGASSFVRYSWGTISNLRLVDGVVELGGDSALAVGANYGLIDHVFVSAALGPSSGQIAGLASANFGIIRNSSAKVTVEEGGYDYTAALVAQNVGLISGSWSEGTVRGFDSGHDWQGGLVALNRGTIENSYSLANTRYCKEHCRENAGHGGLIGETSSSADYPSKVVSSYAAGRTAPPSPVWRYTHSGEYSRFVIGGVVGYNGAISNFDSTYWVTDSSKHNPKRGAGSAGETRGIAGLTMAQIKAALPKGFDPKIWGQSPAINDGYPYLLANPPR